jgi:hypothetical protein
MVVCVNNANASLQLLLGCSSSSRLLRVAGRGAAARGAAARGAAARGAAARGAAARGAAARVKQCKCVCLRVAH